MTLPSPTSSTLTINVFDGARQPFPTGKNVLYTILDGRQEIKLRKDVVASSLTATGLPFFDDDDGDRYSVVAFSNGYKQSGFFPVNLSPLRPASVDLMLIPKQPQYSFADGNWQLIGRQFPWLAEGVDAVTAQQRYELLMEDRPAALACLLNIVTAMAQVALPAGTPLSFLKEIVWDNIAEDRFFVWCDASLVEQVHSAANRREFAPVPAPWLLHPGATRSWKQAQFGEANVQFTFHENDRKTIDGFAWVLLELDMDYYKDPAAHVLLEVLPNELTGGLTNPAMVYVLRWIAGRHTGVDFEPPYTIV
jgi:hypothetical protein